MIAWMSYTLLITALAGVTALALEPLARSRRLPLRWIWVGAITTAVVVSAMTAFWPAEAARPAVDASANSSMPVASSVGVAGAAGFLLITDAHLAWGWLAASLLAAISLVAAALHLYRVRRGGVPQRVAGETVLITEAVGPGAAPFGAVRILLPRWVTSLEQSALRLVVLHERQHVRTGDPALLLGGTLALVIMPWNPVLWWCVRRLRSAIELDCDQRVLADTGEVRPYAELLLRVAELRSRPTLPALLALAQPSTPLERRLRMMTQLPRTFRPAHAVALGAVVVAAFAVACETPRPEPVAPVSTYTWENGNPSASKTTTGEKQEVVKAQLAGGLLESIPTNVLQGGGTSPVLMVYDDAGTVLSATRLNGVDETTRMPIALLGIEKESIASVEVIKGRTLPPALQGGLIIMRLKPGATLKESALHEASKLPARGQVAEFGASADTLRAKSRQASAGKIEWPVVEILDASGKVLFSQRMEEATKMRPTTEDPLRELPIDRNDIERVDIVKPTAGDAGLIRITLKAGRGLRTSR